MPIRHLFLRNVWLRNRRPQNVTLRNTPEMFARGHTLVILCTDTTARSVFSAILHSILSHLVLGTSKIPPPMCLQFTCSVKRCTKVMQPINRSKLQNSFVFLFERFLARRKALQRKSAHRATAKSVDTTKNCEKDLHKTRGRCHAHYVTFFKSLQSDWFAAIAATWNKSRIGNSPGLLLSREGVATRG